jgi:ATP-dependent Clp protease ATP-binding subunit ClpA
MNVRFSLSVKQIISRSFEEAQRLHSPAIGPGHLLLALLKLAPLSFDLKPKDPELLGGIEKEIEEAIARETAATGVGKAMVSKKKSLFPIFRPRPNAASLSLTPQAEQIIRKAVAQARVAQSRLVEALHLADAFLKDHELAFNGVLVRYGFGWTRPWGEDGGAGE